MPRPPGRPARPSTTVSAPSSSTHTTSASITRVVRPRRATEPRASTQGPRTGPTSCSDRSAVAIQSGRSTRAAMAPPTMSTRVASTPDRTPPSTVVTNGVARVRTLAVVSVVSSASIPRSPRKCSGGG